LVWRASALAVSPSHACAALVVAADAAKFDERASRGGVRLDERSGE
jgi:hypothetical protein